MQACLLIIWHVFEWIQFWDVVSWNLQDELMAHDKNRSALWIPTALVCYKKRFSTFWNLSLLLWSSPLLCRLCCKQVEHALKGDSPIFSLSRICLHIPLTLSLSLMSLSSSYILSFDFQTPSLSLSHAYFPHFFCLSCTKTHKHTQTRMETCTQSAYDLLSQWETGCSHGNGLHHCLYSWHAHTQIEWHKQADAPTHSPHIKELC